MTVFWFREVQDLTGVFIKIPGQQSPFTGKGEKEGLRRQIKAGIQKNSDEEEKW